MISNVSVEKLIGLALVTTVSATSAASPAMDEMRRMHKLIVASTGEVGKHARRVVKTPFLVPRPGPRRRAQGQTEDHATCAPCCGSPDDANLARFPSTGLARNRVRLYLDAEVRPGHGG